MPPSTLIHSICPFVKSFYIKISSEFLVEGYGSLIGTARVNPTPFC